MSLHSVSTRVAEKAGLEARTYAKVDRRLLPFLFLCYILAYLDRVNVGFAKLQMLQELSLSDAAFATGAGIFFAGYFGLYGISFWLPSEEVLHRPRRLAFCHGRGLVAQRPDCFCHHTGQAVGLRFTNSSSRSRKVSSVVI